MIIIISDPYRVGRPYVRAKTLEWSLAEHTGPTGCLAGLAAGARQAGAKRQLAIIAIGANFCLARYVSLRE